jgi:8-oxo-dGTP diphosphatase
VSISPEKIHQVVGVVLLRPDGAALLQHRENTPAIQDPDLWVVPGGHLEADETPEEGAVREFQEETNYLCAELRPVIRLSHPLEGIAENQEVVFFWEQYDGRQRIECHEGQALRFVFREDVESLPHRNYLTRVWDLALAAQRAELA